MTSSSSSALSNRNSSSANTTTESQHFDFGLISGLISPFATALTNLFTPTMSQMSRQYTVSPIT